MKTNIVEETRFEEFSQNILYLKNAENVKTN